ncbi:hypothetical protein DSO57_1032387 [Entomophthora muscae]|uniref:Uncharacterized protein n=1 Tax=Entomophthora muscae TaxID=34485 RepID=A0ACC2S2A3_9FUNG|nr:hypothetical protein DSO57_1032387 [Entomophthora muscae]
MDLNLWAPPASSQPTPNLTKYVIPSVKLLYLDSSLIQCNILAKAFRQAINLYSIVFALYGFELPDLSSYVTKVLPSILGISSSTKSYPSWDMWSKDGIKPDKQKIQAICKMPSPKDKFKLCAFLGMVAYIQ